MQYVIKLSEFGYFCDTPYKVVHLQEAKVFQSMKDARGQLNRLTSRLGFKKSEVMKYNKALLQETAKK